MSNFTLKQTAYFAHFSKFVVNPNDTPEQAFFRLAEKYSWKTGSKTFRESWMGCFGQHFSMSRKEAQAAKTVQHPQPRNMDTSLAAMLDGLQITDHSEQISDAGILSPRSAGTSGGIPLRYLDTFDDFQTDHSAPLSGEIEKLASIRGWSEKTTRKRLDRSYLHEILYFLGNNVERLEVWQLICTDLGVPEVPSTITQCKKVRSAMQRDT